MEEVREDVNKSETAKKNKKKEAEKKKLANKDVVDIYSQTKFDIFVHI